MARTITKELAKKIAEKLQTKMVKTGGVHDIALIYHNGVLIADFGIRRASEKDKGHDHVPKAIFVGPGFAKLLGQCPKSREDWIAVMRAKGKLPAADNGGARAS
jgi:hypothetical protein